jgi:hypothetical protein
VQHILFYLLDTSMHTVGRGLAYLHLMQFTIGELISLEAIGLEIVVLL